MALDSRYLAQVELLVRTLPVLATEPCFALKGGTAINLFVRDLPRLSVDIDLAYLPLEPRPQALASVHAALKRMVAAINGGAVASARARLQQASADQLRFLVMDAQAQIKVELSPVLRGALHTPVTMRTQPAVQARFGDVQTSVLAPPDLYGGKLCAALDRQHPRDLFDVMLLLEAGELSCWSRSRHSSSTSSAQSRNQSGTGFWTSAAMPRPLRLMPPRCCCRI